MNKNLTITNIDYIKLSKFWNGTPLYSKSWRIYFHDNPGAVISLNGCKFNLKRDTFYVIPAHLKATGFCDKNVMQLYIHFQFADLIDYLDKRIFTVDKSVISEDVLKRCIKICEEKSPLGLKETMTCMQIISTVINNIEHADFLPIVNRDIRKLVNFIYQNINSNISIDDLVENSCMSKATLNRQFKENVGYCINEYIKMIKCWRAGMLLRDTDMTIDEIADFLGFSTRFYFSKIFKKINGASPGEYRKKISLIC